MIRCLNFCWLVVCLASIAIAQLSTAPSRVRVSQEVLEGRILKKVPPVYPPLAQQARIQGTVVLNVIIDKTGNVSNIRLISGHPMLAPAAMEAVRQWKYAPYELNGEAVEVETQVKVEFELGENSAPPQVALPGASGGGVVFGVIGSIAKPLEGERVSEAAMRRLRVRKSDPIVPAAYADIQGTVVLDERVNTLGAVEQVIRISGPPSLAQAAMLAVKDWKYLPYVKDGKAISVVSTVQLTFAPNGIVSEPEPSEDARPQIPLPRRVRVSSGVSRGLLLTKVDPQYPPDARDARIQGTVVLQATIDKEGNIASLELVSGHPMLAPAAIEAVKQWKYRPYLLNGTAVEVETSIQVNFTLAP